jgi:hypothetical protein
VVNPFLAGGRIRIRRPDRRHISGIGLGFIAGKFRSLSQQLTRCHFAVDGMIGVIEIHSRNAAFEIANGIREFTLEPEEIDAEIAAARKARRDARLQPGS